MQRASAVFGVLVFVLWLIVLAVGVAYVTVWAATRRRPQWAFLSWFSKKPPPGPQASLRIVVLNQAGPAPTQAAVSETASDDSADSQSLRPSAQIIPFGRPTDRRRSRSA